MSERRYFGTDGIRGVAGRPPLTVGLALRLGRALAAALPGSVVIGRDTRQSGPALRDALSAGLLAGGADVVDLGVLPTPAVAGEVLRRGAACGLVVTASHNPYADNGIKVFGPDGTKVDDALELQLERDLDAVDLDALGDPGRWHEDAAGARDAYLASLRPAEAWARGLRVVGDAANGAASAVAGPALAAAGAQVEVLGDAPDGVNINRGCGALHPENLSARVRAGAADLGIALDGDADRCIVVLEDGDVLDGDVLIALLALHRGLDQVVGTVMSNEGGVRHLAERGVALHRAAVGDRNVMLMMQQRGARLGGESSGHVIQLDRGPAGDGLATALAALELRHGQGRALAEAASGIRCYPSVLEAVRVADKVPLERLPGLAAATAAAEQRLDGRGRVLIRYSGTEPVLRVFVEGADLDQVKVECSALVGAARAATRRVC